MDPNKAVTIRTYAKEMQTQIALMELESSGIEAEIQADDCGGSRPELQVGSGVRLLVNASDRDKAQDVLRVFERKLGVEPDKPDEPTVSTWPAWICGCLIGVIFASLAWGYYLHARNHQSGMFSYDLNKDGRWDTWWTYTNGVPVTNEEDNNNDGEPDLIYRYEAGALVKVEWDRNFDGQPDSWQFHTNNQIVSAEVDDNFDGKADARSFYKQNVMIASEHDADFNGIFDMQASYQSNVLQVVEVRPNGSKYIARREQYEHGILRIEWIDEDNDGTFDWKRTFDPMGFETGKTAISVTNSCSP